MTTYKVLVGYDANGEPGVDPISFEADSVVTSPDWIQFHSQGPPYPHNIVAVFPKDRVIAVTTG